MKKIFTLLSAILVVIATVDAQLVIKNNQLFRTADQMLLANELNSSGEPFAESLGYNLDDLNPMVPNSPDSTAYTLGIENYEYSRYLLQALGAQSGLGLHIMWSPMVEQMAAMEPAGFDGKFTGGMINGFNQDDELMMMVGHFSMLSHQMAPANAFPQFADFESGNVNLPQPVAPNFQMDFASTRWDRSKMDKTLNLAAMGQSLMKQYLWAADMLGAFHDSLDNTIEADGVITPDVANSPNFDPKNNVFYGGNNLDGFMGQVITAQSMNKTMFLLNKLAYDGNNLGMVDPATYDPANGIKYFPHRIAVTEKSMGDMMPPMLESLTVSDASSHLFDQLSFLWATSSFQNMMNPAINDAQHLAYHSVFDGDPFPAPMSVTGAMGPYDMMMGASKVLFLNTMAMHFNETVGTFVDVSTLGASGQVGKGNLITAPNAGYILVVLARVAKEFAGTPMETMANNALVAQTNFIINKLKNTAGGFNNSYTIGTGASTTPQKMASQAAIIRGLYAAYESTNNANLLVEANAAYDYLINYFYVPSLKVFKTEKNNQTATYTPFNLAVLSGALREASLVGKKPSAAAIYTRVFKAVYNKMILSEAEQSGEDGTGADGDGVPYIVGGNLPFVFAAEAQYNIVVTSAKSSLNADFKMSVYPNPVKDYANVEFSLSSPQKVKVSVLDLTGRKVQLIANIDNPLKTNSVRWNTEGLNNGIYFIRLDGNHGTNETLKVIINK